MPSQIMFLARFSSEIERRRIQENTVELVTIMCAGIEIGPAVELKETAAMMLGEKQPKKRF